MMAQQILSATFATILALSVTNNAHASPNEAAASLLASVEAEDTDAFPQVVEANIEVSPEERFQFVLDRDRLANRLEATLTRWVLGTRKAEDALKVARLFYASGDAPDKAFEELQKLPEFAKRFPLAEFGDDFSESVGRTKRLTLLAVSAWTIAHERFVREEGLLAEAARRRTYVQPPPNLSAGR